MDQGAEPVVANLLFLTHRLPYPPDKGDKVRSYHLLKHLLLNHQVYLGTFVDDPADLAHVPRLRELCAEVCAPRLRPPVARLASLTGLLRGQPLTLPYYRSPMLAGWVSELVSRQAIDATVVFSSAMSQYVPASMNRPVLVDMVDVDSAKWTAYAQAHRGPLSWIYQREGERLADHEVKCAALADCTFLATEKEAALFRGRAPDQAHKVQALFNGVDTEYFGPSASLPSPFAPGEIPLVFTGAMDYWPNIDAVIWFAAEVLPALRQRRPELRFHIIGRNPPPRVLALASVAVSVSGTVPDVRPYLQHAAVVVAPLRLARGIQNKVLEAMAMARPVVAARECIEALDHRPSAGLEAASQADDYVQAIERLLVAPDKGREAGLVARGCVVDHYRWDVRLSAIDPWLP